MHGLHAFRVGDEVLEFPCRDVLEEHLIEFLEWAIRRLALVEEQVDPAQHGETAKDGLVRVEDVEQDKLPHREEALPDGRGDGDGLDAEARCRCLGDDGVRDGSDGEVVGKVVQDRQGYGG